MILPKGSFKAAVEIVATDSLSRDRDYARWAANAAEELDRHDDALRQLLAEVVSKLPEPETRDVQIGDVTWDTVPCNPEYYRWWMRERLELLERVAEALK